MNADEHYQAKFIENFLEFGVLHRARVALRLLEAFENLAEDDEIDQGSVALEIVQTYMNACEDVALWLLALEAWAADADRDIRQCLSEARFRGPHQPKALDQEFGERVAKLQAGSGGTLAARFRLPSRDSDDWSWIAPTDREWYKNEIQNLAHLLNSFFFEPYYFAPATNHLTVWRAWNKVKHGMNVSFGRHHSLGLLLTFHLALGARPEYFQVRVQRYDLKFFVAKTFIGAVFLARLVWLLYVRRFEPRKGSSWLHLTYGLDQDAVSRRMIDEVLSAVELMRHDLVINPRSEGMPIQFAPSGRMGLAQDWDRRID